MNTTTNETVTLVVSPCTNCGSTGWTQREDGEYVRGCCVENGDHRVKFTTPNFGKLVDYRTGETVRAATAVERDASIAAGTSDRGRGVISVGGRSVYVEE